MLAPACWHHPVWVVESEDVLELGEQGMFGSSGFGSCLPTFLFLCRSMARLTLS